MALALAWDPTLGAADLVLDTNNRLVQGDPLVSQILVSLFTDAPMTPGDPAPAGVSRSGYPATAFDARAPRGSKLWMTRYVRPREAAMRFAEFAASDALAWMVAAELAASIECAAAPLGAKGIELRIVIVLTDGARRAFRAPVPY